MNYEKLLKIAIASSNNSYSPYSNLCVGTALLTKNGEIYSGCNVENHGIQSICGERVAFSKAFSEGEPSNQPDNYVAIMVVGHKFNSNDFSEALPCGYCRQFMSEFVNKDFKILTWDGNKIAEYTMSELLPFSFNL